MCRVELKSKNVLLVQIEMSEHVSSRVFMLRQHDMYIIINPPAPKVLGRDRPDGTRKRLQVYLGGGHFSAKTSCF